MGRWCWVIVLSAGCSSHSAYQSDKSTGGSAGMTVGSGGSDVGSGGAGGANAGGANAGGSGNGGADGGSSAQAGSSGSGGDGGAGSTGKSGFPSCETISDTACNGDDCCASLLVNGCQDCAFPSGGHTTTLSDFVLDKYEVTVGRFRSFVNAYGGPPMQDAGQRTTLDGTGWQTSWMDPENTIPIAPDKQALTTALLLEPCATLSNRTFTETPADREAMPMNCVTWYEAFAFCVWDGGFLPTEVEWQYAAAGGAELRLYPWPGTAVDTDHALYGYCGAGVSSECTVASIPSVGSKPAGVGKYGQLDLGGSLWEWVLDVSDMFPPADPCDDCATLQGMTPRGIRGGSWTEGASFLHTDERGNDPPRSRWHNVGFRCARVAP